LHPRSLSQPEKNPSIIQIRKNERKKQSKHTYRRCRRSKQSTIAPTLSFSAGATAPNDAA
jgi:hypothetical protein